VSGSPALCMLFLAALVPCASAAMFSSVPDAHAVLLDGGDGGWAMVSVVGTSLPVGRYALPVSPAAKPAGIPVEPGHYGRMEWDKGGYLTDNFSARWTSTLNVATEGEYTFYVTTDDGARLKVGDQVVVDAWQPRAPTTSEARVMLTKGEHAVAMEYFEGGGGAMARLEWSGPGVDRQVVPRDVVSHDGTPGWQVDYFDNVDLEGKPAQTAHADAIDNEWADSGPRIGEEMPGHVAFDWTPVSDTAVVIRANADEGTGLGFVIDGKAKLRFPDRAQAPKPLGDRVWWCPATPGSDVLVVGLGDLPDVTVPQARAILREALQNAAKPSLPPGPVDAGRWISLFDGKTTDGWAIRNPSQASYWVAENGELDNRGQSGSDIHTTWTFNDCDLHIEFKYPKDSNSGVYLQGRYEIQVLDSYGTEPWGGMCGAIYHVAWPDKNVTKPAGEWQTFDVKFTAATVDDDGRIVPARITVAHNGVETITDAAIPRATGSEMDRNYLLPAPLMLQGDHGPVTYRNIRVRPR